MDARLEYLVPPLIRPIVGWLVGMDWPQGDEEGCFRASDRYKAAAAAVGAVIREGDEAALGVGLELDGIASDAFQRFWNSFTKLDPQLLPKLAEACERAAKQLNDMGLEIEYCKYMILLSLILLAFQIAYFLAMAAPSFGTSLSLIPVVCSLTRMTIQQFVALLLRNILLFALIMGGMDGVIQGIQMAGGRRDEWNWAMTGASVLGGAFAGAAFAGMGWLVPKAAGARFAAAGAQGLERAAMTGREKWAAFFGKSAWGMMFQSSIANTAASVPLLAAHGQLDGEMLLKNAVAGFIGGADGHLIRPTHANAAGASAFPVGHDGIPRVETLLDLLRKSGDEAGASAADPGAPPATHNGAHPVHGTDPVHQAADPTSLHSAGETVPSHAGTDPVVAPLSDPDTLPAHDVAENGVHPVAHDPGTGHDPAHSDLVFPPDADQPPLARRPAEETPPILADEASSSRVDALLNSALSEAAGSREAPAPAQYSTAPGGDVAAATAPALTSLDQAGAIRRSQPGGGHVERSPDLPNMDGYRPVGPQSGSHPGGFFMDSAGATWYVKALPSELHAKNEVLAFQLYREAGVIVPRVELLDVSGHFGDHQFGTRSLVVDGRKDLALRLDDDQYLSALRRDFAVDAWLANWDVVGRDFDNIISTEGGPVRSDAGGALLFRGLGEPKGIRFTNFVDEIQSMRDRSKNREAAQVFRDVADHDVRDGVVRIASITERRIDELIDRHEFPTEHADVLKETLKSRRLDLMTQWRVSKPLSELDSTYRSTHSVQEAFLTAFRNSVTYPGEGYEHWVRAAHKLPELRHIPYADLLAAYSYTHNNSRRMNSALESLDPELLAQYDAQIRCTISGLSQLPTYSGPLSRVTSLSLDQIEGYRRSEVVIEPRFTSARKPEGAPFRGNVEFVIESRTGRDVALLARHPDEQEVVFLPNTKFSVLDVDASPGGGFHARIYLTEVADSGPVVPAQPLADARAELLVGLSESHRHAVDGLLAPDAIDRLNRALESPVAATREAAQLWAQEGWAGLQEILPPERGTVYKYVDWPADRLADLEPGRDISLGGILESTPVHNAGHGHHTELVIHSRSGVDASPLTGRGQVLFGPDARFCVLAIEDYQLPVFQGGERYRYTQRVFLLELPADGSLVPAAVEGSLAPRPLDDRLQRYFDHNRWETPGGVAYLDVTDPRDVTLVDNARRVRSIEGVFTVDSHGNSLEIRIAGDGIDASDLAALLSHDARLADPSNFPGTDGRPVIRLLGCATGQGFRPFAQYLANETGWIVIAPDNEVWVDTYGTHVSVSLGGQFRDSTPSDFPPTGAWLIFVPEDPL